MKADSICSTVEFNHRQSEADSRRVVDYGRIAWRRTTARGRGFSSLLRLLPWFSPAKLRVNLLLPLAHATCREACVRLQSSCALAGHLCRLEPFRESRLSNCFSAGPELPVVVCAREESLSRRVNTGPDCRSSVMLAPASFITLLTNIYRLRN